MKFDTRTIAILKNFSDINPSIVIKPGDEIGTIAPTSTIMAKAKISQMFENEFGIYDLTKFLGALSLFKEPEIQFFNKFMTIKSGEKELNYTFSEPSLIMQPKKFKLPEKVAEFKLLSDMLGDITKGLSVLGLPEVGFMGDGQTISVQALDTSNPSGDNFKIANVGETDKIFSFIFKAENMKVIAGDYDVSVTKGVTHFVGKDLEYMIVAESKKSKF